MTLSLSLCGISKLLCNSLRFNVNYSPVQFHEEKKEVINGDYARNILADRFCEKERADKRVNSTYCEKGFGGLSALTLSLFFHEL